MAYDINSVVLVGRLTRESELRFLNNGTAVARFSLAVNRMKRSGEQREEEVSYFDIVVWGKQAEVLNPYLTKGRQVCINGELRQSRWDQDGQSRSKVEINAQQIQLVGGQQDSQGSGPEASQKRTFGKEGTSDSPEQKRSPEQSNFQGLESFEEDIPF